MLDFLGKYRNIEKRIKHHTLRLGKIDRLFKKAGKLTKNNIEWS